MRGFIRKLSLRKPVRLGWESFTSRDTLFSASHRITSHKQVAGTQFCEHSKYAKNYALHDFSPHNGLVNLPERCAQAH
ncbi:hypothetical protein POVCU1_046720 [Plasmodium ovale curtisi]|uniref:Uncharacterized protein n=1 Tax=Plasmodium ovale curtisi TaxID=864141 RepID=A0A1A8X2W4_PLAOA|nr:hypothetical protein POVCU1_046720 [Plasmodium ovale curtisi]